MNRETYLNTFIDTFALNLFEKKGYDLKSKRDKIRVTCSLTNSKKAIGEHWGGNLSEGGLSEILISPFINRSIQVLGVVVHELVHAMVGNENGHNHVFRKCAIAVGLTGKMTATTESDWLVSELEKWITENGEYPHKKLLEPSNKKKQSTRLLKAECPTGGEYKFRITKTIVENYGLPECPCCFEKMTIKGMEEEYEGEEEGV